MTHDPLCPVVTITEVIDRVFVFPGTDLSTTNLGKTVTREEGDCQCALIARVREDERGYAKQTSAAVMAYGEGKRDGVAQAVAAIEALGGER